MKGKCPHCLHDVYFTEVRPYRPATDSPFGEHKFEGRSKHEIVEVDFWGCPNCERLVVCSIVTGSGVKSEMRYVWPRSALRIVPPEVPDHIKKDFLEAAEVLQTSSKASAALSRRCLQTVLVEAGHVKAKDLSDQIDEVLPQLPTHLKDSVDAIRAVGNFGAHPIKSKSSGQIVDVEPGEADWNLDVLEGLFDFYYVQPARTQQKRAALEQKLKEAGKPPLK